jgi:MFS family permease
MMNAIGMDSMNGVDRRGAIAAISSISAIGIAIGLSFPLLSIILDNRGYSADIIGANAAMAGIASLAAVWLVAPMARMIGVANTLIAAALISAISLLLFFIFDSLAVWFVLRIVFHGALTLSFVLSEFWINSASSEAKRGTMLGIYATFLSLGFAIGPGILALTGASGVAPFAIGFLIIASSAIPVLLVRSRAPLLEKPVTGGSAFLRFVPLVPLATGAVFVFGAVEQSGLTLFPIYGQRLGYSEFGVSLLLIMIAAGNVALQLPLGIISDRVSDRRKVLYFCGAIGAVGTAAIPLVTDQIWLLCLVLFVWGGMISGLYTVGLAHLGSRLEGTDLAEANSAFVFSYTVGMTLGPQLAGIAMEWSDPHGFILTLFAFFIGYLLLATVRAYSRDRPQ